MKKIPLARLVDGRQINAVLSARQTEDHAWDDFLRGTPLGQFQHSSLWALVKQTENWKVLRATFEDEKRIIGGFQLLWRPVKFGRIGYINKGPVLPSASAELKEFMLDILVDVVRSSKITALVIQPPDFDPGMEIVLRQHGFAPNHLMRIMDATVWADLTGAPDAWEKRMRPVRRTEVRKAVRLGVTIQEGGPEDIPLFFKLMSATCERQKVHPNPPTVEAMAQLDRVFRSNGEARLAFACVEGERVAGVFDLKFGNRVITWKKGWDGRHAKSRINELLTYESMRWAKNIGATCFDFGGVLRELADNILSGQPLTEAQKKHYDSFKLGFGGQPKILPPALIYWRNPLLRYAYRSILTSPKLTAWLGRFSQKM